MENYEYLKRFNDNKKINLFKIFQFELFVKKF